MSYDHYVTGGDNPGYDPFDPREFPEPEEEDNIVLSATKTKEKPMTISNSFEVRGPYQLKENGAFKWFYQLFDDGGLIADIYAQSQQEALEKALLMAAAPRMADLLEAMVNLANRVENGSDAVTPSEIREAYAESRGTHCEVCETLGQPSRMVFGPSNHAYHKTCVPENVKREIAAMDAAADREEDRP